MEPCVARGLRIVALPYAEEASDAPCDTGSEVELLKVLFPEHVDFDNVKHGWWVHEGEFAFDTKALISRAAKLRRWLKNRPERAIVLVAHGFFNHFLTGDVDEEGNQSTPWWNEAELRTYTFVEDPNSSDSAAFIGGGSTHDGEDSAMIKETEESLKRLGDRRNSVVKNRNVPAQRKKSLVHYESDNELN